MSSVLNPWRIPVLNPMQFRGSRVIIVGPASTVLEDLGEIEVNDHDYVVRLNNGIALALENAPRLGNRTDILFHNLNEEGSRSAGRIPLSLLVEHGVRFCVFPHWSFKGSKSRLHRKRREMLSQTQVALTVPPKSFCTSLRRNLGGYQPTVGASAIVYFLRCELAELQIHGFSFFQTPYLSGYNDAVTTNEDARDWVAASEVHNPAAERALITKEIDEARRRGLTVVLGKNVVRFLS